MQQEAVLAYQAVVLVERLEAAPVVNLVEHQEVVPAVHQVAVLVVHPEVDQVVHQEVGQAEHRAVAQAVHQEVEAVPQQGLNSNCHSAQRTAIKLKLPLTGSFFALKKNSKVF